MIEKCLCDLSLCLDDNLLDFLGLDLCHCPIPGRSTTIKLLALGNHHCRCIVRIVCTWCCNTSGESTIMSMSCTCRTYTVF